MKIELFTYFLVLSMRISTRKFMVDEISLFAQLFNASTGSQQTKSCLDSNIGIENNY